MPLIYNLEQTGVVDFGIIFISVCAFSVYNLLRKKKKSDMTNIRFRLITATDYQMSFYSLSVKPQPVQEHNLISAVSLKWNSILSEVTKVQWDPGSLTVS